MEQLLRSREKRFRKLQCFAIQFNKVLRAQLAARHVLRGHHHIGNGVMVERDVKPGVNGAAQRLVRREQHTAVEYHGGDALFGQRHSSFRRVEGRDHGGVARVHFKMTARVKVLWVFAVFE